MGTGSDEVVHQARLNFLRFTFTWSVKDAIKLHTTEEWWKVILELVESEIKSGSYQTAMSYIWNYHATSPKFGSPKLQSKAVEFLVQLEPKLKGLPDYQNCIDLLQLIAPNRLQQTQASITPTSATPIN